MASTPTSSVPFSVPVGQIATPPPIDASQNDPNVSPRKVAAPNSGYPQWQTAHQPSQPSTSASRSVAVIEFLRHLLYFFDFVFGVLMWGNVAANVITSVRGFCLGYGDEEQVTSSGIVGVSLSKSPECAVFVTIGVMLTFMLVLTIIWHSMACCNYVRHLHFAEFIAFCVMSFLWFVLAVVSVATVSTKERDRHVSVRVSIAAAWVSTFVHIGSASVAFLDWKQAKGKQKKAYLSTTAMTQGPVVHQGFPQQPVQGQDLPVPYMTALKQPVHVQQAPQGVVSQAPGAEQHSGLQLTGVQQLGANQEVAGQIHHSSGHLPTPGNPVVQQVQGGNHV